MKELYFDIPLYKTIRIEDDDNNKAEALIKFLDYDGLVDGYNPELNENTSYRVHHFITHRGRYTLSQYCGLTRRQLKCVRTGFVIDCFFLLQEFDEEDNDEDYFVFQKIGQYPTIADLEIGKYKKYSKILEKNDLSEFNKAIGLASHGVGVGSFVYLRRIFENLIEKYHQKALSKTGWDEDKYNNAGGMTEKISLLKDLLPELVVKYKKVYSIVSKGIHELEEQECLKHFPIIKDAIILILEKDYLQKELEENEKNIEKNLSAIASKLK